DLSDRQVYVLDPMLATGGTLAAAIELLLGRGAYDVTAICLLAAPEGLGHLRSTFADRDASGAVATARLDQKPNDRGHILPPPRPGRPAPPPLRRRLPPPPPPAPLPPAILRPAPRHAVLHGATAQDRRGQRPASR